MLPDDKRMVLHLEQVIPAVTVPAPDQKNPLKTNGVVDYAAL